MIDAIEKYPYSKEERGTISVKVCIIRVKGNSEGHNFLGPFVKSTSNFVAHGPTVNKS